MQSRNISPSVSSKFRGVIPFPEQTQYQQETPYITGITRDSNGNALPGCFVDLFTTGDDIKRASTISDLATGAYSFQIGPGAGPYYCVGFKLGLPEVGGVTVDSLTSTSSPFNSSLMSGCTLWAKADTLATTLTDGALIGSWTDSSGSGNTLTQSTSANKPIYKSGILNGLPVVRFTGVTQSTFLDSAAPAGQKPTTIFIVLNVADFRGGTVNVIGRQGFFSAGLGLDVLSSNEVQLTYDDNTLLTTDPGSITLGIFQIIETTYGSSGDYLVLVNGQQAVTPGTNNQTITADTRRIGQSSTGTTASLDGDIAELLIFNSALSLSDRVTVRNYLARKYAITVNPS